MFFIIYFIYFWLCSTWSLLHTVQEKLKIFYESYCHIYSNIFIMISGYSHARDRIFMCHNSLNCILKELRFLYILYAAFLFCHPVPSICWGRNKRYFCCGIFFLWGRIVLDNIMVGQLIEKWCGSRVYCNYLSTWKLVISFWTVFTYWFSDKCT